MILQGLLVLLLCYFSLSQRYNTVYLQESDFYLSYQLENTGNPAVDKVKFRLRGKYKGWIGLGVQSEQGKEDISILYLSPNCEVLDYYREQGSQILFKDDAASNVAFTGGAAKLCQAGANTDQWDITIEKIQITNDQVQDVKVISQATDISYRITLYKGYKIAGSNDVEAIKILPKSYETYTIKLYTRTLQDCIFQCSSKTNSCTDVADYKTYNTNAAEFEYTVNAVQVKFCFPKSPTVWNKLYEFSNEFNFYYGIIKLFKQEYDVTTAIEGQQKSFIYFKFDGVNQTPKYQGYIGINIARMAQATPLKSDLMILTKQGGVIEIQDRYLDTYDYTENLNSVSPAQLDTGLPSQIVIRDGDKNDSTNYYNVTVIRPISSQHQFDTAIEIDDETKVYEIRIFYGTTDFFSLTGNLFLAQKLKWENVAFKSSQVCGFQCHKTVPLVLNPKCPNNCLNPSATEKCYICETQYCNGPDSNQCLTCHKNCLTCNFSPYSSACKSCVDQDNRILYPSPVGECVIKRPYFENKIILNPTISLYYGYETGLRYIYFRLVGSDGAKSVKLSIQKRGTAQIDNYIIHTNDKNVIPQDIVKYSSGGVKVGKWDVQFFRDVKQIGASAIDIQSGVEYDVTLFEGANLADINPATQIAALPQQQFASKQICHSDCSECSGPEQLDCLKCSPGREFEDTLPGKCSAGLTPCNDPQTIRYKNVCILYYPRFWNKIVLGDTGFELYYGFDMQYENINPPGTPPTYMYFRLVGHNKGWVALGFGKDHLNTDMVVIRIQNGEILVEDRYSQQNREMPGYDTNAIGFHYKKISGSRSDEEVWDVSFVRLVNTGDPQDFDFSNVINYIKNGDPAYKGQQIPVILALGDSDIFVRHSTYKRLFLKFEGSQVCHPSCSECIGPEQQHCTNCTPLLYGLSNNTPPNICKILEYSCHVLCQTCFGPSYTQCLTCTNLDQMPIDGKCTEKTPAFWNKIEINSTFLLYYGYSKDQQRIYFRFKGFPSLNPGWIGMGFGDSMNNCDMVILRYFKSQLLIEDRFSNNHNSPPSLDTDIGDNQNVYYISGQRTTHIWDVIIMRTVNIIDKKDIFIDTTPRDISIAWGNNDLLTKHADRKTLKNIRFRNFQVCQPLCLSCTGPEDNECNKCIVGYEVEGNAPNICKQIQISCHPDCKKDKCKSTSRNTCTECADLNKFTLLGTCYYKTPTFWNLIQVQENFQMYYGFDQYLKVFYLRFKGNQNGWVGIGFGKEMRNTDMIIIRKDPANSSNILLEDRYSLGHTLPLQDSRNHLQLIKGSWFSNGDFDVYIARSLNTKDTARDGVIDHEIRDLVFAFGKDQQFSSIQHKHESYKILKMQKFDKEQVCQENCAKCTGPEIEDCQKWNNVEKKNHIQRIAFVFYAAFFIIFVALL